MGIIKRFKAKTPKANKDAGRFLSTISAALTGVEAVLLAYSVKVPDILHQAIIGAAILTAIWAAYHGQKVKR